MELVKRLREMANAPNHHPDDKARWKQAADEIAALRRELEKASPEGG